MRGIRYAAVVLICCLMMTESVTAAERELPRLMQNRTDDQAIHLFVKGVKEPEEITCRFGSQVCTEIGWHSLMETGEERETLVLIDNSLSTGRRYRQQIETTVLKLFEHASENEKFCIATFGETTEYQTEYTNLYKTLEDAVLAIEYRDRDTYLTDAVMEALDRWNGQEAPAVYRRIMILTDGQEAASLEHTHEELYLHLKENPCPVYTVGCNMGDPSQLSHMAVLSRITGATAYTIDRNTDEEQSEQIALSLLEDRDVLHITLVPETEWMDGSDSNAKMMFLEDGVVTGMDVCLRMPFQPETTADEKPVETPTVTTPTVTPVQPMTTEATGQPETENMIWLVRAIAVMLGVLAALMAGYALILKIAANRKRNNLYSSTNPEISKQYSEAVEAGKGKQQEMAWERYENTDTQLLRLEEDESSKTTMLFGEDEVYEMMLTDQNNPAKFFSFPIKDSVIVGRNSRNSHIVLDYDASVSGRHCEIENRGGRFYVKDLQSANGTRVNGIKVLSETELLIGNLLRLGQVEMKVGWSTHG